MGGAPSRALPGRAVKGSAKTFSRDLDFCAISRSHFSLSSPLLSPSVKLIFASNESLYLLYCPHEIKLFAVKTGFSVRFRDSTGTENPLTQQIKPGSPIHAAFDQFEAIGMAFEQTITVG